MFALSRIRLAARPDSPAPIEPGSVQQHQRVLRCRNPSYGLNSRRVFVLTWSHGTRFRFPSLKRCHTHGGDKPASWVESEHKDFGIAISECAKGSRWPEAIALLQAMEMKTTCASNVVTYNATINACAKALEWQHAIHLFDRMSRQHLKANVVTFSSVMKACRGHWEICLQLMAALGREAQPNSISFNAAISAAESAAQWTVTLQLLNDMDLALLDPDIISHTGAMRACTLASHWRHALRLFASLPRRWADRICWNAAMEAAEAGSQWQLVLQFWDSMTTTTTPYLGQRPPTAWM
eukprot:symbB.v1.2.007897.t1/scaffold491.1/size196728/1